MRPPLFRTSVSHVSVVEGGPAAQTSPRLRHERFQGEPMHTFCYSVAEWALPEFGILEFDYASLQRPPCGTAAMHGDTFEALLKVRGRMSMRVGGGFGARARCGAQALPARRASCAASAQICICSSKSVGSGLSEFGPTLAQLRPILQGSEPSLAEVVPTLVDFGQLRDRCGRLRANLGRTRATALADLGAILVEFGRSRANVRDSGPDVVEMSRIRVILGQIAGVA